MRTRTFRSWVAGGAALALAATATIGAPSASAGGGLVTDDLTSPGLDAADLAGLLVGEGVEVDAGSVLHTGNPRAAGSLGGGDGILGFEDGIVLSSGQVADIVGPNAAQERTTAFDLPGDPALTELSGGIFTEDASILEFDFIVGEDADEVSFQYVFGSEEYNRYVGTEFNDVFAFFVNGVNCAVVGDGEPVSINTINAGRPAIGSDPAAEPSNPELFVNNDPFTPDASGETVAQEDLVNTEMNGFTVVLTCVAPVEPGTNTMRLAIADAGDAFLDSWVVIKGGSLTTTPPEDEEIPGDGECVDLLAGGGNHPTTVGDVCVSDDGVDLTVTYRTTGGWTLDETHLAVSGDEPGGGEWTDRSNRWQNSAGQPAPGRFPHAGNHDAGTTTVTYVIPLVDLDGTDGGTLHLGAHAAVVVAGDAPQHETAWGAGDRFVQRGDWATHFDHELTDTDGT